jgi:hypothetical protein
MTSYFILSVSQNDMINLFDNSILNIREFKLEADSFHISIRHNEKDNAMRVVKNELANLNIQSTVDAYHIPEPSPRCW